MAAITKRSTSEGVRYDVRWRLPDGTQRKRSFRLRGDADRYAKKLGGDEVAGLVIDPNSGEIPFGRYAESWIESRIVKGRPLAPKTKSAYAELLRNTLSDFDPVPLVRITPDSVRSWYSALLRSKGPDRAAKAYRILRSVMNTAVRDRRIGQSPCLIEGGGQYEAPERPMVETDVVLQLADAIEPSMRAIVMLAGFAGLRPEELLALTRADVDLMHRQIRVDETVQEINGIGRVTGPPKSEAGKRTVAIPRIVVQVLDHHLSHFAQPGLDGYLFVGERLGRPLGRNAMYSAWHAALRKVPAAPPGLRIYDLRHHAATTTARMPGITTKELMARIGHASMRAALKYQHATEERDGKVADWLDGLVAAAIERRAADRLAPVVVLGEH